MRAFPRLFTLTVPFLLLGLTACGGGGSATPMPPPGAPTGTGAYWMFTLAGNDNNGAQEVRNGYGEVTFAADGNVSGAIDENADGSITTGTPINGFTWSRATNGALTWQAAVGNAAPLLSGGMPADAMLAVYGSVLAVDPTIGIMVRKQGMFSNASLAGEYHGTNLLHLTPSVNESTLFSIVFDGQGAFTPGQTDLANDDGTIGSLVVAGGTYSVAPSGLTVVNGSARGAVMDGGGLVVLGGGTNPAEFTASQIYIRAATGATTATLSGDYWYVMFQHVNGSTDYTSMTGTMSADGVSAWRVTGLSNTDGSFATTSDGGTYGVAPNGVIQFGNVAGGAWRGAVSANGAYGFLGGGIRAGDNPTLIFFVRK